MNNKEFKAFLQEKVRRMREEERKAEEERVRLENEAYRKKPPQSEGVAEKVKKKA